MVIGFFVISNTDSLTLISNSLFWAPKFWTILSCLYIDCYQLYINWISNCIDIESISIKTYQHSFTCTNLYQIYKLCWDFVVGVFDIVLLVIERCITCHRVHPKRYQEVYIVCVLFSTSDRFCLCWFSLASYSNHHWIGWFPLASSPGPSRKSVCCLRWGRHLDKHALELTGRME